VPSALCATKTYKCNRLIGDKSSILALRAICDNSAKVSIEVQLRNFGNMDKRSLFDWSQADGEPVGRIMRYTRLTEQQISEL
jgi:hypothetical protein